MCAGTNFHFSKKVKVFVSGKSNAYYCLLLRSSGPIDSELSAKECNERLKALSGESSIPAVLKVRPAPILPPITRSADADDESVDGDEPASAVVSVPVVAESESGSEVSPNTSSSSEAASSSVEGDELDSRFPAHIFGQPIHLEKHRRRNDEGIRISCRNPDHFACKKYRSTKKDMSVLGPLAPVLFLKTWQSKAFDKDSAEHKKWRPKLADIRAFVAAEEQD